MKIMNKILKITVAMIIVFCVVETVIADSFFKQVIHTNAYEIMGQKTPEQNDTTVVWLTEGKAYSQTKQEPVAVFDTEKNVLFVVSHERNEYLAIPLNMIEQDINAQAESNENTKTKINNDNMSITEVFVTPTNETRKIGNWETTKYNIEITVAMVKSELEYWASEDIKVDITLFNSVGNIMTQIPGYDKYIKEMKKIKGMPVLIINRTSVMGTMIETTTTLIEHYEKDAPDGIFDIPEDYTQVGQDMPIKLGRP